MINHTALIIDMKNSRGYAAADREELQRFIKKCIHHLNRLFAPSIEMEMVFSGGDEVQGLFTSPAGAYLYGRLFNLLLSPVETRIGIGVGEWNIRIEGGVSTEQDGEAYHHARHAIQSIDEKEGYNSLLYSGHDDDIFINTYINTATLLISHQTDRQKQFMLLSELLFPITRQGTMNLSEMISLVDLIRLKTDMDLFSSWSWMKKSLDLLQDTPHRTDEYFTGQTFDPAPDGFEGQSGRIKGLSNILARLSETTRQNADKMIKSSHLYAIRALNRMAFLLMDRFYGGDGI